MHERQFFNERAEMRSMSITCARCRHVGDYQVKWMRRTRKPEIPPGANERDHATFASLRDYLIRLDEDITCEKCRRRVDIASQKSLVFL